MKKHRRVYRFQSRDGLDVRVYRLHADDADLLVDLFEHMSSTSRYQRFNEYLDHPDPEHVRRSARMLSEVDPKLGAAWIAVADLPGQPDATVAGARFVRTRLPGVAEISIAVRDDLQRQGIGTELMVFVARRAKAQGIHKLTASFHTSNRPIWALIADAPFSVTTEMHGAQTDLLLDLDTPEVEEMQEPVLAA